MAAAVASTGISQQSQTIQAVQSPRGGVVMYMSRDIMHCKPGKTKELVSRFKKLSSVLSRMGYSPMRIYTDVSGEHYWTVVIEQDIERIDDMAEMSRKTMTDPDVAKAMEGYHEYVVSGKREFFKREEG
jgi:hypothetical protein